MTRRLWPRRSTHIVLYSARHQFAAIAKLVYDPTEVADLMGHASDWTAFTHYGRHSSGGRLRPDVQALITRLPTPAPDEVLRVRPRRAASRERLATLLDRQQSAPTLR